MSNTKVPADTHAAEKPKRSITPLLDAIESPADLRKLDESQLGKLCDELRLDLVDAISQIGGHFASSLGVVELTVALHYVLNTPDDRIVWDTGHQGYIHKMLTGRRAALRTVRQHGGISGFLRREESEFDCFGAGHAGTSISAATGMIEAGFHGGAERKVAAVIGDGSMTSGMAFEALNHAGQLHRKLIVVLNDNEMSIAPNVGVLSLAFSRAVTNRFSTSARRHFKSLVERGVIPHTLYRAIDRAEEATQGFFSTPAMLFSSFGFRYIGPVDGHDVEAMVHALRRAADQDGPVVVHALTLKGKGYLPAEDDPVKYHGVTPFEPQDGVFKKPSRASGKSYTAVFGEFLVELAKKDPSLVGITAAMPDGTGLKLLQKELPDQYFDVGIAEQHAVTFAAGLAAEGRHPYCVIYSTFLQRAFDQVLHDVCIQKLPVIFCMDRAGLVGADGATHHGVFDIAYLRSIPNLVLMAPKDELELRDMMLTAGAHQGPSAIRYPRGEVLGLADRPAKVITIGEAELIRTSATPQQSVLLIGYGNTVSFCEQAAELLAADDGIDCTVINARFAKPLDEKLIASSAAQHALTLVVEDHAIQGGIGSAVLELLSEKGVKAPVVRLGVPDHFIEHGTQEQLYRICGFDVPGIVDAARKGLASQPRKTVSVIQKTVGSR